MMFSKYWISVIYLSYYGSLITSSDLSLIGSKEYIVSDEAFTLTCSSSAKPRGGSASFFINKHPVINLVRSGKYCFGVPQGGSAGQNFECNNSCSCSLDGKNFTWTYSGLLINKTVTFQCSMDFGINANNITSKELAVNRAYGPSSVSLNPESKIITTNETDQLGPIQCSADCVPNCTYTWSGPGITENISFLLINNIQKNRSGIFLCSASNFVGNGTVELVVNVQYGPDSISLMPSNESYTFQEHATIEPVYCTSSCNPDCKQNWAGPENYSSANPLILTNIKREQAGQYTCTSRNVINSQLRKINIIVLYGPPYVSLNVSRSEITVNESGQVGPISCKADCEPVCTYIWNGSGLSGGMAVLQFTNISRNRTGTYSCTATNFYGSKTVDIHIVVQFGPDTINLHPSNGSYTVQENTSIGPITCNSSCYPVCKYTWAGPGIYNGNYQLHVLKTTRNNSGEFTCIASNIVKSMQTTIIINIEYGPSYVYVNSSITDIIVNERGQVGPIQCTADCVPACTYRWSGPGISRERSVLQITNISRNGTGSYICTATNTYGNKTVVIHIVVHYGPSAVFIMPSNQTYILKENSDLNQIACNASCKPECEFYWTGPTLASKPEKLHISNINRSQTGIYKCIAHNDVGISQTEIHVTVLYAARVLYINTPLEVQSVMENTSVSFFCQAEGLPIPKLSWYRMNTNGTKDLVNTTNATQIQHNLPFSKCTDTGTYICEANNILFPLSNKSRDLNVTCAPRLENSCSSRRLIAVKNNATVSLAACFLSNPVPNVKWTLVDANSSISIENNLSGVHQNSLILYTAVLETKLTNTREEQYGVYAYNSVGKSNVEMFTVVVEDRPFPPQDVMVACKEINTLYWIPNFNGGSEQVFRVIFFENNITASEVPENISDTEDGKQISTVLRNLKPNKPYTFQVIALNKFNRTASNSVYCLTAAPSNVSKNNMSGVIGGITGTTLAIVLIVIGIVVFWTKRRNSKHKSDAESKGRKKLTAKSKEDEDKDGLKDNILYESAGQDFVQKQEPIGTENATVTKHKKNVNYNGDRNIQETALYSEVMKKSKNDQNADVYTNVVKSTKMKEKHKGKKKESREDVYENMSGEVGNVAFNYTKQESRNKDGLVYADLIFNPSPNGPRFIHGVDDRTIYADVDTTQKIDPLPDSDEEDTDGNKPTGINKTDRNID